MLLVINHVPSQISPLFLLLKKTYWVRQDKLILSAILASTTPTITLFIFIATTSQAAWCKLNTMYSNKSRSCAIQLKKELTLIKKGNRLIQDICILLRPLPMRLHLLIIPFQRMILLFIS